MTTDPCKSLAPGINALSMWHNILWRPSNPRDRADSFSIPCEPTTIACYFIRDGVTFGVGFFGVN